MSDDRNVGYLTRFENPSINHLWINMSIIVHQLDHGWSFRQADGGNHEWLPVAVVPTNLHLDLHKHRKYANLCVNTIHPDLHSESLIHFSILTSLSAGGWMTKDGSTKSSFPTSLSGNANQTLKLCWLSMALIQFLVWNSMATWFYGQITCSYRIESM